VRSVFFFSLFLTLILSSGMVSGQQWPVNIESQEGLFREFFLEFKRYMKWVNDNHITVNTSDSRTFVDNYRSPNMNFKVMVVRKSEPTEISETLLFSVQGSPAGKLVIKRRGPEVLPQANDKLLNFELPEPDSAESYDLSFHEFDIAMKFRNGPRKKFGQFIFFQRHYLTVIETMSERELSRKYNSYRNERSYADFTAPMTPESTLIARQILASSDLWERHFFLGNLTKPVSPLEFYDSYKNEILDQIRSTAREILYQWAAPLKGWPIRPGGQ